YAQGFSRRRPWLIGNSRTGSEIVPEQYKGYTFDELEQGALAVLQVNGIRSLISELYPLIIVDEFQDVDSPLFEIISLLGQGSRLVLLSGPGQCIYQGMKKFDPDAIMQKCVECFAPEPYELFPENQQKQRHCAEISKLVSQYSLGRICLENKWPTMFQAVYRLTKQGRPKELETQASLMLKKMKTYLRDLCPDKKLSLSVLSSTNQGVADIYNRLKKGSDAFKLRPIPVSLHFDDALLLHYGRLILELLRGHWIACNRTIIDASRTISALASLFQHAELIIERTLIEWQPLSSKLCEMAQGQKHPKGNGATREKLEKDLKNVNKLLRARKDRLPYGSPSTPFTKADNILLQVLSHEFLKSIGPAFRFDGLLNTEKARRLFENSMQQRIIFEKLGVEIGVQVMTIHKAKGREFDGVVLVLEDNRKALWKKDSHTADSELEDIYRVAISRAKDAFGLIAYDDEFQNAKPAVQRLLPENLFSASS
ncbi:UvrD-helicase domain-containing protein, partial [bacterium]|nr:UvrD-helicase domain-containing protein [bacterium]